MARGEWTETDRPIRPGMYNRFINAAEKRIALGQRGILGMPVKSNWGKPNEIVTVTSETDLIKKFGNNKDLTAYRLGRIALLGGAKELKLYRMADSNAAPGKAAIKAAEKEAIELETNYPTTRDFNFTVEKDILNEDQYILYIFDGARQLEEIDGLQGSAKVIAEEITNRSGYVNAKALNEEEADLEMEVVLNEKLVGGNDGIEDIAVQDYIDALAEFEAVKINGIVLDGISDEEITTALVGWADRVRKDGKKVRVYIGGSEEETPEEHFKKCRQLNNPAVYRLGGIGYAELNGDQYTPAEAVVYDAAKSEGKDILASLCNADTIWTDIKNKLTPAEFDESIRSGAAVYKVDNGVVKIEDDVNTYTRYDLEHGDIWGNVRAIQFIDMVDEDTADSGNEQFVGKILNSSGNTLGHKVIISALKGYFETLAIAGIIEDDFIVEIDEELQAQAAKDELFWLWDAEYIEVTKRIYGTGRIR